MERHRQVERGLPAERGEDRVRPLALQDRRDRPRLERLDVRARRHLRVGHDRRRIGVDEDDLIPLFPQRLGALRAGVVELAGLPDDDGTGPENHDFLQIVASRHSEPPLYHGRRRLGPRCHASRGGVHEIPARVGSKHLGGLQHGSSFSFEPDARARLPFVDRARRRSEPTDGRRTPRLVRLAAAHLRRARVHRVRHRWRDSARRRSEDDLFLEPTVGVHRRDSLLHVWPRRSPRAQSSNPHVGRSRVANRDDRAAAHHLRRPCEQRARDFSGLASSLDLAFGALLAIGGAATAVALDATIMSRETIYVVVPKSQPTLTIAPDIETRRGGGTLGLRGTF